MSLLERELSKHVDAHSEIRVLRSFLDRANYAYEALHAPIISDQEYDEAFTRLKTLEAENPWTRVSDSVTEKIGLPPQKPFSVVKHYRPMQSLNNTYSIAEAQVWLEGLKEKLGSDTYPTLSIMHKFDGLAISLVYIDGLLNRGVTRGDGKQGEDVTHNVRLVSGVPARVGYVPRKAETEEDKKRPFPREVSYPGIYEVRGEVVMPRKAFLELNERLVKEGKEPYATPRNAAAASMRMLDPRELIGRELEFCPYAVYSGEDHTPLPHYELNSLNRWGFNRVYEYPIDFSFESSTTALEVAYARIMAERDSLPYDIDGIVLRVANVDQQQLIPGTRRAPGYAIALKFPAERAVTTLTAVEWQVGRTGVLTPVAILEPVDVGGVTISRSTLHNIHEISRLRLFLKAKVIVARAGDVIPKIIGLANGNSDFGNGYDTIVPPATCPCCGTEVVDTAKGIGNRWRGSGYGNAERAVYCPNQTGCHDQMVNSVTHLLSREALNVDGIGEATVTALINNGDIKTIADVVDLSEAKLARAGCPAAKDVAEGLGKNPVSFGAFLYGLGIRHIGVVTAEALARTYRDMTALAEAATIDLSDVEGMGMASVGSLLKFVTNTDNLEAAKKLEDFFKPIPTVVESPSVPRPLRGETWVITGHLEHMDRVLAESVLKRLGATVSDNVGKRTTRLVVGSNPGSKLAKAHELGVPVMTEAGLHILLSNFGMTELDGIKVGFF